MKEKRSYTAKAVFSALGKSVLYLLFFLAMQRLVTLGFAIAAALRATGERTRRRVCRCLPRACWRGLPPLR